ncbi:MULTISPECIES: fumarylacetoacetate hydrolase family protein [Mesorhizobium]|uniref:2-keto-4-pentenoate hydratase n=1 Tax=Mesorhizobium TaxID=68287 RepID=UPI0003CF4C05|nr:MULTISPECIES: fumarylacetoacetate hydrolase family protein [Mesorhizobium]ESY65874.1 hypothetical protein X742_20225 [Mesorhizobium sp. LNHC232B00]WJI38348.1 fumarylacetoacetate hydrolase family protein [Mesorhizobium opportunistum]
MSQSASEHIHYLSERLLAAYRGQDRLVVDDAVLRDVTRSAALEIQRRVVQGLATPVVAWKAALLADADLVSAPIVAERLFTSPCALPQQLYGRGGVECEIAFRFSRAPTGGYSFTQTDILDALDGACAAIEVVDSRWGGPSPAPRNAMVADLLANGALVCGAFNEVWQGVPFSTQQVKLRVNGALVHQSAGGHPDSDLIGLLVKFAGDLRCRGIPIEPGTIVTTGSFTGLFTANPGDVISAEFEGFEPVSVTFEAGDT